MLYTRLVAFAEVINQDFIQKTSYHLQPIPRWPLHNHITNRLQTRSLLQSDTYILRHPLNWKGLQGADDCCENLSCTYPPCKQNFSLRVKRHDTGPNNRWTWFESHHIPHHWFLLPLHSHQIGNLAPTPISNLENSRFFQVPLMLQSPNITCEKKAINALQRSSKLKS